MIGKLFNLLGVFSLATVLAASGFVGFLFATGKLSGPRIELIAKAMRGELDAPASQPAETHVAEHAVTSQPVQRKRSADELREQQMQGRIARARTERAAREVAAQRELLDVAAAKLMQESEAFERRQKEWETQRQKLQQQQTDAGFESELKLVSSLSAAQAKEHVVLTWKKSKADAVRLLKAMTPSRARKILELLKTPEEVVIMHELLEQLRYQDIDQFVPPAGTPADER